jgi:hypothetical protein
MRDGEISPTARDRPRLDRTRRRYIDATRAAGDREPVSKTSAKATRSTSNNGKNGAFATDATGRRREKEHTGAQRYMHF